MRDIIRRYEFLSFPIKIKTAGEEGAMVTVERLKQKHLIGIAKEIKEREGENYD